MLIHIGKKAKAAERVLMTATLIKRNGALGEIACSLREKKSFIISENEKDILAAKERYIKGLEMENELMRGFLSHTEGK